MKKRILVMNGQRIVQEGQSGDWVNQKVDKASGLKPGIYNISAAKAVDKEKTYSGSIVHADAKEVYQQTGKGIVVHSSSDFDIVPNIGEIKSINYNDRGRAVVAQAVKLSRSRSL